jgi:hypothetical protein
MSTVKSILSGSINVITDIVSANVLTQILLLTTQHDLLIVLSIECIIVLQFIDEVLMRIFAKSEFFSDMVERAIIRFVAVLRIAFIFVLIRIGMGLVTEIFETSRTRWHELVVIIVLLFGFVFILIERSNASFEPIIAPIVLPKKTT